MGTDGHDGCLPDWFVVREARAGQPERTAALALLAGSPGRQDQTDGGGDGRRLFVSCDPAAPPGEAVVAAAAVLTRPGAVAELGALAVAPAFRGRRLAGRMLTPVAHLLRGEGVRRLVAGVQPGDGDMGETLEGVGFRPLVGPDGAGRRWLELEL